MGLREYFRPVPTLTAEELRRLINGRDPETLTLLDVRQPAEYEREHLPGALLIPLGELNERMGEIDRTKPVIVY